MLMHDKFAQKIAGMVIKIKREKGESAAADYLHRVCKGTAPGTWRQLLRQVTVLKKQGAG